MREVVLKFPVWSEAVRRELVGMDICPNCGGALDTGRHCMICPFDGSLMVPARLRRIRDREKTEG